MAFRSVARCSRMASSTDRLTHQPDPPNTTAAMIGHTQSCRRRNRAVAWTLEEPPNQRDTAPVRRPTDERDIGPAEVADRFGPGVVFMTPDSPRAQSFPQ